MVTKELISPNSIVVVGGSDNTSKPGGNVLKNLLEAKFQGQLYVVNPKLENVQGVKACKSLEEIPPVDLAILAIPAEICLNATKILCNRKSCKAIIIFSAGFHEEGPEGAKIESEIVSIANKAGTSLIGPNCIGVLTPVYAGVFTKPLPKLSTGGVDIISGSGATVVFILETALKHGLPVSSVFSVGNSAQIGAEDILEYMDENYVHGKSAPVKLLYIESINNPGKLLKHASSLVRKGARIAAVKSGYSEAGSRAASSHTGAIATPDKAVSALFKKSGIIRCYGRTELVTIGAVMMFSKPEGERVAVITHAGGPAVMLTDVLSENGLKIPEFSGPEADRLLSKLYHGSSVSNPVDFLATGTAGQMEEIIDACVNTFSADAMVVIFGSPGLTKVYDVYEALRKKSAETDKPMYPVLPSIINASEEIEQFQKMGGISFPDEVIFGTAFAKFLKYRMPSPEPDIPPVDFNMIRSVIDNNSDGYLSPEDVAKLLDASGISRTKEAVANNESDLEQRAREIGFPLVLKVVGPVHKSDVGGVSLNINDRETLISEFNRMMHISGTTAVLLQPMLSGSQIFIGAKRESNFGHLIMCGLGGIFVEVLHDISMSLSPVSKTEAEEMIKKLRGYRIIQGIRGQEGVNETMFADAIQRVSALCAAAPEISEMDLNPLLGNKKYVIAVDARIRIEKNDRQDKGEI